MIHAFSESRDRGHRTAIALLAILAGLLSSLTVVALPDDRNQAIYIQSDRAERDERKGTTVYTGDVEIDQGSLHISAEQVTIRSTDDEVSEIVATGSPAKMHQKPAADREPVYARARTIQYDVTGEVLTLVEQATVTQEGSTVTGERIVYYVKEQRVKASAGSAASGQPRVETIIPPRRNTASGATPEPATPPAGSPGNGAP
ncbi:MAG: lipopolysaccharide transport periplasmic protein LptA [Pseudomonadales bacterium]|nr:lipopolysaccharide transport periplasmic protein LptA [Pseudomonadales bacterium]